jgi:pimeloyl-ACP methyl ester carboxylesterase
MKHALTLITAILIGYAYTVEAQEMEFEPMDDVLPVSADLFARDTYRIDPVICPFKGEIEYEPGDIECGLLQVPENREDPESRFIELHFVKLNSRWGKEGGPQEDDEEEGSGLAPGKRDDPVIYLTGGPGARVNYYVNRFKDHGLLDHRDLYVLEQRGIGYSGDFCQFYSSRKPADDDVETFAENLEASRQNVIDCAVIARAAGVDLNGYNTIENARDVKALRRALGFEQWNVWGISYGSILGQAYIKEDPEGILAVALDAIMPLDIQESELYWRVAHWYDRDLRKLQEICDRQPACAKRYPDMGGRLREAVRSVVGDPIVVDVKDVENYPSGKARFFQDVVAFLPFIFLYEQDNYPALPGLIYAWADAVVRRDETFFQGIAAASGDAGFGSGSDGMRNAIFCLDGDAIAQARAGKKDILEHPVLGSAIGSVESYDRSVRTCLELGMPPRDAAEYAPVATALPSLIIEGDMDPITPPPNAKAILPGFENGTYVEFPFAGHGPSRSVECAGDMLNAFYDDPAKTPDLACVDEMAEPDIWAPMYVTDIAPRLMALLGEDRKKLAVPALWAGLSLLVVLVAFLYLGFAMIVRLLEDRTAPASGFARPLAWLASAAAVSAAVILGSAMGVTAQANELLLVFGMAPWARWGAWLGLLAGVLGVLTVAAAIRSRREDWLPAGSLAGFLLTGAGAVGFSAFLLFWSLGPF